MAEITFSCGDSLLPGAGGLGSFTGTLSGISLKMATPTPRVQYASPGSHESPVLHVHAMELEIEYKYVPKYEKYQSCSKKLPL